MAERLKSVGLDVGTTSTQMILSELVIENRASSFAVPEMEIGERKILYQSPVHFTPLLDESHVDAAALRNLVQEEYRRAGIRREDVDTGAIIITGETSRKENARAVLEALADYAGEFVVATAGPDLESILAAKGAGAVDYADRTGKTVLHMDIGGGTSNLALIRAGKIVATGCLNVGGRLVKLGKDGMVTYVSPVLSGLTSIQVGQLLTRQQAEELARLLTAALETAAGRGGDRTLLERLRTKDSGFLPPVEEAVVVSFSGGVADCIAQEKPWLAYGDLGPTLGKCILESQLCEKPYVLGQQTIRATVIGAGCHSAQLSGSTVFYQNVTFPLKNMPVAVLRGEQEDLTRQIRQGVKILEGTAAVALPGLAAPSYRQVREMAEKIAAAVEREPVILCLEQDMAKALGQALAVRLGKQAQILCIDRVKIPEGSYLDVGQPVGPALPVVVKTLVLSK